MRRIKVIYGVRKPGSVRNLVLPHVLFRTECITNLLMLLSINLLEIGQTYVFNKMSYTQNMYQLALLRRIITCYVWFSPTIKLLLYDCPTNIRNIAQQMIASLLSLPLRPITHCTSSLTNKNGSFK